MIFVNKVLLLFFFLLGQGNVNVSYLSHVIGQIVNGSCDQRVLLSYWEVLLSTQEARVAPSVASRAFHASFEFSRRRTFYHPFVHRPISGIY